MHIRNLIEELLPYPESEEFAEFVWGKDYQTAELRGESTIKRWNENHGDKLMLSLDGLPAYDIPDMIMIWREQNGRASTDLSK